MFGLKTRKQLKRELEEAEKRLVAARSDRDELEKALLNVNAAPEGCKVGEWCSQCAFGRRVCLPNGYGYLGRWVNACGKGICGSFKEKNCEEEK